MKRCRLGILAFLCFAILAGSIPVFAQQSDIYAVYVNGVRINGAHPVLRDGIAYLPVNTMAQALGVSIHWDSRLNVIKINDQMLAARPFNDNGTLLLPVESVVQALNGTVEWDGRNQAIRISSKLYANGPNGQSAPSRTPIPITPPSVAVNNYPAVISPGYPTAVSPTYPTVTSPNVGTPPSGMNSIPYPSPAAYPPSSNPDPNAPAIRPPSAPPQLGIGLDQPPAGTENGPPLAPGNGPPYGSGAGTVYVPKSTQNNIFAVTVTNIETVSSIKDYYHPRPGYRFIIVYLSQQNVSNEVQIYTGRFSLLDQNNRSFDYIEGLSNFWLVILRPYGINFGYLVFELPFDAHPTRLALHALNQSPLTLNL